MGFATISVLAGGWILGDVLCDIASNAIIVCLMVTVYNITVMTANVYVIIAYPLRYNLIVTSRRVYTVLIAMWSVSVIITGVSHAFTDTRSSYVQVLYLCLPHIETSVKLLLTMSFIFTMCHVPCLMTQLYCHIKLVFIAREQKNKICPRTSSAVTVTQHIKELKTIIVVTGSFVCTWLPFTFHVVCANMFHISAKIIFYLLYIVFLKSSFNWMIYTIAYPTFRNAQYKIYLKIKYAILNKPSITT